MYAFEQCSGDDDYGSFDCFCCVFICVLSVAVLLFNIILTFKLFHFLKKWTLEMVALLLASLEGLFLFLHNFLYPSIKLMFTAFFLQVITFSFVNFCFALYYFRMVGNQFGRKVSIISFSLIAFVFIIIFLFGNFIYPFTCDNFFYWQWNTFSVSSLLVSLGCGLFAYRILSIVKISQTEAFQTQGHSFLESIVMKSQACLHEQKKIIIFIIISFVISTVTNFLFDLFAQMQLGDDDLDCDSQGEIYALTYKAQLYLFFRAVFQIWPITILPWGFYIIPFILGKKIETSQIEDIRFEHDSADSNLRRSVLSQDHQRNSIPFNSKMKSELEDKLLLSFQEKTVEEEKPLSLN